MKRIRIMIGDVFAVPIDEHRKKYFQFVARDGSQLGSDVIRAFEETYPLDEKPDLEDVVHGAVQFYAHVIIRWGYRMGLWDKVGRSKDVGTVDVLFRGTNDYGAKVGEEPVRVSKRWFVWRINEEYVRVGELKGENRKSEIGVVVSPPQIVLRMRTGTYSFVYPGFE